MMIEAFLVLTLVALPESGSAHPPLKVSRGVAVLSSAVLPGTGELLLGAGLRGEVMMWLDGALLGGLAGLSWYATSRESDARLQAARWAGADLSISESRYYRALEGYDNAEEYNEQVRSDARARFPQDPARQRSYFDSLAYSGISSWNWSSDSARYDYWNTRRSSRSAELTGQFAVAALVLNRLVSVVDCAFFVVRAEPRHSRLRRGGQTYLSRVEFSPGVDEPGIKLSFRL
jgi:hypothetical protein